jgi:transposase
VRSVGRAIGLDVHRDVCEVAIVEDGVLRSAGRVATTPARLELFARSLGANDRVALEVSGGASEITRTLEPHVRRVVVVSPADTGIRQARAKTDRLDARTLAELLAAGELDAVWSPDEWTRVLRRRLAPREQLVRARSHSKNEIHAVLVAGWWGARRCPTCSGSRGASGCAGLSCRWRRRRLLPARRATRPERR